MGKFSRTKGHGWERDFIRKYYRKLDPDASRMLEYQEGLGMDVKTNLPFALQGKNSAIWKGWHALDDLERYKGKKIRVGFIKQSSKKSTKRRECIVMPIEDFLILAQAALVEVDLLEKLIEGIKDE